MLETLSHDIHIIAATLLAILILLPLKQSRASPKIIWNVAFSTAVLAYALRVLTKPGYPLLAQLLNSLEYTAPIFFIICIRANFQEPFLLGQVEKALLVIIAMLLVLSNYVHFTTDHTIGETIHFSIWLQFAVTVFCVVWAYRIALQDWDTDLVSARRTARSYFVFGLGPAILLVIGLHLLNIAQDSQGLMPHIAIASIIITACVINLFYGVSVNEELYETKTTIAPIIAPQEITPSSENALAYQLELNLLADAMSEKAYFREMGLTLKQLAEFLHIPEYRLRNAINSGLGYRNFNAYLNHFRVDAVAAVLRQSDNEEPILDISLAAGFKSLSTFNKAFRETMQTTPSEYRKRFISSHL